MDGLAARQTKVWMSCHPLFPLPDTYAMASAERGYGEGRHDGHPSI